MSHRKLFVLIAIGLVVMFPYLSFSQRLHDKGILFLKLGNDTTVVQEFELNGDSIHTRILRRPGGIQMYQGDGMLFPDGNIRSMQSSIFRFGADGQFQKVGENKLYTTTDSTFIESKPVNRPSSTRAYGGHAFVANDMDYTTFLMFPFVGHFSPAKTNDSITGKQFVLGAYRVFTIKRTSERKIRVGSNIMGYLDLQLNADGSVNTINGIGSSLNFTGTVEHNRNMDSVIHAMINYQQSVGAMAQPTIRDTAFATIGLAKVEVDYWRPSMRGRKIFGEVVPWNRFWRTGANNATQLRISQPIYFDDQKLDSGKYSIFTWPTKDGWTLLINKQSTIWGTDYNADYDILRLPMKIESLPNQVEQLTIKVIPSGNTGTLAIEWENTRASIQFESNKK